MARRSDDDRERIRWAVSLFVICLTMTVIALVAFVLGLEAIAPTWSR